MPALLELDRGRLDDATLLDPSDIMSPEGYRPRPVSVDEDDASLLSLLPKPKKKKRRSFRGNVLDDEGLRDRLDDIAVLENETESRGRKGREQLVYRVGPGDTLLGVAREFATDVDDVARANGLSVGDKLREGTLLKLDVRKDMLDGLRDKRGGTAEEAAPRKSGKRGSSG